MTPDEHAIDRVLRQAADRSAEIRAETRQTAVNLERLIQLVIDAEAVPEEFRPRLIAGLAPNQWSPAAAQPIESQPLQPARPIDDAAFAAGGPAAGQDQEAPSVFGTSADRGVGNDERAVFTTDSARPREADPSAFATPPETPAIDPQNLRPEDGGIALAYAPGDMLFSKGDPAEVFFVITEGRVSLFEPSSGLEMAVLSPGGSLGEQSILMGGVHSLSARAIDRVVCTTVRADRLRTILDQQSGVVKPVFEAILLQLSMHNELRGQGNGLVL